MAKNLYNLTAATTVNDSDLLHVNQGSVSSDKKVTKANLLKEVNSSITSLNSSLANITEWHWADSILQNNWSSNGMSVYGKIKDIGFVQFSVRNGTLNTTVATLPSGFRPSTYSVVVPLLANGVNNGYALINTNGTIVFNGQTTASCFFNAIFPVA